HDCFVAVALAPHQNPAAVMAKPLRIVDLILVGTDGPPSRPLVAARPASASLAHSRHVAVADKRRLEFSVFAFGRALNFAIEDAHAVARFALVNPTVA